MKAMAPAWTGMNGTESSFIHSFFICVLYSTKNIYQTPTQSHYLKRQSWSNYKQGFFHDRCWLRTFPFSQGSSEIVQPSIHHQTGRATSISKTQNFFWNPTKFPGRLQNRLHENLELPMLSFQYRKGNSTKSTTDVILRFPSCQMPLFSACSRLYRLFHGEQSVMSCNCCLWALQGQPQHAQNVISRDPRQDLSPSVSL